MPGEDSHPYCEACLAEARRASGGVEKLCHCALDYHTAKLTERAVYKKALANLPASAALCAEIELLRAATAFASAQDRPEGADLIALHEKLKKVAEEEK